MLFLLILINLVDFIAYALLKAIADLQFPPFLLPSCRVVMPLEFMQETLGADIFPSWSLQCTKRKRQVWLSVLITSIYMSLVSMQGKEIGNGSD